MSNICFLQVSSHIENSSGFCFRNFLTFILFGAVHASLHSACLEAMVFCYQNCSDQPWEKNCYSDWEKNLKFEAEGQEFCKNFEITRTIYLSSERWEQFLVTECFFQLSHVSYIRTTIIQIGKKFVI